MIYNLGQGGGSLYKDYEAIKAAGEDQVDILVDSLDDSSTVDIYTDVFGVNPSNVEYNLQGRLISLFFDNSEEQLKVKVRIS